MLVKYHITLSTVHTTLHCIHNGGLYFHHPFLFHILNNVRDENGENCSPRLPPPPPNRRTDKTATNHSQLVAGLFHLGFSIDLWPIVNLQGIPIHLQKKRHYVTWRSFRHPNCVSTCYTSSITALDENIQIYSVPVPVNPKVVNFFTLDRKKRRI